MLALQNTHASPEVKKCQHQPELQEYLAQISFTQADQNLQEQCLPSPELSVSALSLKDKLQ